MSDDQFTLDVDPEGLREVKRKLTGLSEQLTTKGTTVEGTPGEIGDDWTGDAATSIKAEMTGLGAYMKGMPTHLQKATEALGSLATDYDDALRQVADLNRRWNTSEDTYDTAVQRAQTNYEDATPAGTSGDDARNAGEARTRANDAAAETRRTTQHGLSMSFGYLKMWLAQQTRTCGTALSGSSPFQVPESVLEDRRNYRYPTEPLDHGSVTSGLAETSKYYEQVREEIEREKHEQARQEAEGDLEDLQQAIEDGDTDAIAEHLATIGGNQDDPYYAEELVRALGAEGYSQLMEDIQNSIAQGTWDYREQEEVLQGMRDEILAFNDTVAAGLQHYEDQELVDFVNEVGGPRGKPPIVLLLAGSDNADGRLSGLALQFAHRYDETEMGPGPRNIEVGPDLLRTVWPDKEEMTQALIDDVDPERFAQLLNNIPRQQAGYITEALRDDNWNGEGGPEDNESWEARRELYLALMDEAASQELPGAMQSLLAGIPDHNSGERTDELFDGIAERLQDPDTLIWMAQMRETIDQEVVARAAAAVLRDVDPEDLTGPLITTALNDPNVDPQKVAEYLGYTLGLMDAAGTDYDYDKIWGSLLDSLVGTVPGGAGKVTGPAWSLLKALQEAQQAQEQAYADHGEGWNEERAHKVFAWTIYIALNGPPEGYEQWLEDNEHRVPPDASEEAMIMYINEELSGEEYDALDDLQEEISRTRDVGDGTG